MAQALEETQRSDFTDIEAATGVSSADWLARIRHSGFRKQGEIVDWLKTEHGFGHGHAKLLAQGALRRDAEHAVLIP